MDGSLPGSSVHGDSPGTNTDVTCHALQGIFLTGTQGLNPHLFMSPALAGGFFTTSATWEAPSESGRNSKSAGKADTDTTSKISLWSTEVSAE